MLKAYKFDIKIRCKCFKDLERMLELLALELSNEQAKITQPFQVKRSKVSKYLIGSIDFDWLKFYMLPDFCGNQIEKHGHT